jgi:hypothetical protein
MTYVWTEWSVLSLDDGPERHLLCFHVEQPSSSRVQVSGCRARLDRQLLERVVVEWREPWPNEPVEHELCEQHHIDELLVCVCVCVCVCV